MKCHIHMVFEPLQRWGPHHRPGQPGPMPDHSVSKEIFPNIQSKPPLMQLEAASPRPVRRHTPAHGVPAVVLALPGLAPAPAEHLQEVCKGLPAARRGEVRSRSSSASARHSPRHGSPAAGAGWEQPHQLQHPPAPSLHHERGHRDAKWQPLQQRRGGLPSRLSPANSNEPRSMRATSVF